MQGRGLQITYKEESVAELSFGRIMAPAFLSVEEVVATMARVRGVSPTWALPVLDYFRRPYVEGRRGTADVRPKPADRARRANNVSGARGNAFFFFVFFSLVGHKHPAVWRSVEGFKKDVAIDKAAVIHHDQG